MELARITLFPIKSLDGVDVPDARLTSCGSLEHDRRFALFDRQSRFINGKRRPEVHHVRALYSDDFTSVELSAPAFSPTKVALKPAELVEWFSDYFHEPVTVREDVDRGFPDDSKAWGPTIISTATLQTIASWYEGLSISDIRRRLRTNLELAAPAPFAEDTLFADQGHEVLFTIGTVAFAGSNPCARCVVPTRDAVTGERYPDFQKIFARERQTSLPPTVAADRFDHYFRVAVNTRVAPDQAGKTLRVGEPLQVLRTR